MDCFYHDSVFTFHDEVPDPKSEAKSWSILNKKKKEIVLLVSFPKRRRQVGLPERKSFCRVEEKEKESERNDEK